MSFLREAEWGEWANGDICRRLAGHLCLTVLAYHILAAIERRLGAKGLSYRWQTIRGCLATQMRVTVVMTNDQGERLVIWQTTDPKTSTWKSTAP